jgi:signal transduction histidine kinase
MKRLRRLLETITDRRGVTLGLSITLGAVVALLAFLQYRWISQISLAERVRIRSNLDSSTTRFAFDLNGEMVRMLQWMSPFGPRGRPGDEDFANRFSSWTESSPHRRLVRGLFIARAVDDAEPTLEQFNGERQELTPLEWPDDFKPVLQELTERFGRPTPPAIVNAAGRLVLVAGMPGGRRPPPDRMTPGAGPPRPPTGPPPLPLWTLVELDREYLLKSYVPELVKRHFGNDYRVAIVENSKVIFQSPSNGFAATTADATAGLLQVRLGPQGPPGRDGPPGFRPPQPRLTRAPWELRVWPRSGPLESVVRLARWRNLTLSFAVLGLMSLSLGVLMLSARRARRLASLQMDFVAGVSHELRTPLAVIASAADNIADGVVSDPQRLRQYGWLIREEGRRLSDMVEQVLGFAGAQAGRLPREPRAVEVREAMEEAVAAAEPDLRKAGSEVDLCIADELPPVLADPALLTVCLRNLLANAAKHTDFGSTIGFRAEAVSGDSPGVALIVQDQGPGIEPDDLPFVFDPFYRGKKAVEGETHGTGLGLTMVKRIVEAQGGEVTVESEPGRGARFTIRMPLAPAGKADNVETDPVD